MCQLVVMVPAGTIKVKCTIMCLLISVFVLEMHIYLFHNVFSYLSSFFSPQLLDSFKITQIKSISLRS